MVVSLCVRDGFESQLSVAVGVLNTGLSSHIILVSEPTPEITGAVVSIVVKNTDDENALELSWHTR